MSTAVAITLGLTTLPFASSSTRVVLSLARMRSCWTFAALALAAGIFAWLCYAAL